MNIQERMENINDIVKDIAQFVQTDDSIKTDFSEYLQTIGANSRNNVSFQTATLYYIL